MGRGVGGTRHGGGRRQRSRRRRGRGGACRGGQQLDLGLMGLGNEGVSTHIYLGGWPVLEVGRHGHQ
jgi:hypothetical protein